MQYITRLSLSSEMSNLAFCKKTSKYLTVQHSENIKKYKKHFPPYVDLFLIW